MSDGGIQRLREARCRGAALVLTTGGFGPTTDDLTTETVADLLGEKLRFDEPSAEKMRSLFAKLGRRASPNPSPRRKLTSRRHAGRARGPL